MIRDEAIHHAVREEREAENKCQRLAPNVVAIIHIVTFCDLR
jgi:hypothetical protein